MACSRLAVHVAERAKGHPPIHCPYLCAGGQPLEVGDESTLQLTADNLLTELVHPDHTDTHTHTILYEHVGLHFTSQI